MSDIPGARPAAQVIEAAAQADRARAKGLADQNLVTLMLARRALAGHGAMPPLPHLVEAIADPAAGGYDQVLLARLQGHLRARGIATSSAPPPTPPRVVRGRLTTAIRSVLRRWRGRRWW